MTTATSVGPQEGDLLDSGGKSGPEYHAVPGRTDEYLGPDGTVRTRWKQVAAEMAGLGPSGLMARRSEVARLLRNEGATYNVTRDNQSRRQPWSLDPWPLVVEGSEWTALESAVADLQAGGAPAPALARRGHPHPSLRVLGPGGGGDRCLMEPDKPCVHSNACRVLGH